MEQGTQGSIVLRRNGNRESQGEEERVVDLSAIKSNLPVLHQIHGPSSVSQYFKPKATGIESEGLRTQEAYFRGRKLQEDSIPIPDGHSGFVLGKKSLGKRKASDNSDGSSNCWEMNAKYNSITYWNHDSLPSQDDAFLRCFHWLSVAKSVLKKNDMAFADIQAQTTHLTSLCSQIVKTFQMQSIPTIGVSYGQGYQGPTLGEDDWDGS